MRLGSVGTDWVWTSGTTVDTSLSWSQVDENNGAAGNCAHMWLADLTQFHDHLCYDETAFLCDHSLF